MDIRKTIPIYLLIALIVSFNAFAYDEGLAERFGSDGAGLLEGAAAPWSDEVFDQWARSVFEHQFEVNVVYRRFCEGRGVTPAVVRSWRDVPAVPTSAFKHLDLTPGPVEAVNAHRCPSHRFQG